MMRYSFVFAFVLLVAAAVGALNQDASGSFENLEWEFKAATATLTITGNGDMVNVHPYGFHTITPWANLSLPVRFVVVGEGVTSIGGWVFRMNRRLISVSLPSTLTYISQSAFEGCARLRSCPIPPNVTYIGEFAFDYCENLENITLPPKLETLGSSAFRGCKKIESLDIPSSLSNIETNVFENCTSLSRVTLSDGVTVIRTNAFRGCVNLTTVAIPRTVSQIDGGAFSMCSNLTAFEVSGSNLQFISEDGVIFYRSNMDLVQYPAGKIGAYTVKSNVNSIASAAFYGCVGLTSVKVEANIWHIPEDAFKGCENLRSVEFVYPPQVIDRFAFQDCSSLEVAPISPGCTKIEIQAFSGCRSLKSVNIPPTVTKLERGAFLGCTSLETAVVTPKTQFIPELCFSGCTNLKSVTFSDDITNFGYQAFYECSSLSSLSLPKYTQYIGTQSFAGCNSIPTVKIPSTIIEVNYGAFSGCNKLESITVDGSNSSYSSDGGVLFSGNKLVQYPCGKGDNYVIPGSVEVLELYSFAGCVSLSTLDIPPTVTAVKSSCFQGSGLKSMTIPATVNEHGDSLFCGCADLESVTLESTKLTYLGYSFFQECKSLKYVSLPSTVTSISTGAFKECRSLSNLTIPSELNYISSDAFEGCVSLRYIKYEGKHDPCTFGSGHFGTCKSLDIVCAPLDYADTSFCEINICKTTHCEEEVSKFNHCFELVKCGEPDAEVRLRANASEWIGQTDGCVEYVCDNNTGRLSWSNCNSSTCVDGTCENDDSVVHPENVTIEFTVSMPVKNWNMSETSDTLTILGRSDGSINKSLRVGVGINDGGYLVVIYMLTNNEEHAGVVTEVAKKCSRDPNSPAVYDDMCDEFNCTGFMHDIKSVRIVPRIDTQELVFMEEAHSNCANHLLLLFVIISLMAVFLM